MLFVAWNLNPEQYLNISNKEAVSHPDSRDCTIFAFHIENINNIMTTIGYSMNNAASNSGLINVPQAEHLALVILSQHLRSPELENTFSLPLA